LLLETSKHKDSQEIFFINNLAIEPGQSQNRETSDEEPDSAI